MIHLQVLSQNYIKHTIKHSMLCILLLMIFSTGVTRAQQADTLWSEGFEGNWIDNWYASAGTWEVGTPTSGPGGSYEDLNCAATVLAGNYSEGVRSRLIRFTKFVVPSADLNPRLRFWHWFSFSSGDYGYVQIKTEHGEWQNISPQYSGVSSSVWTNAAIDLSAFADSLVQIGFYFHSDNVGSSAIDVSTGWYIDTIALLYGSITFNDFEDFETGLGDWYVERGTWEVGSPKSGPSDVISGSFCAGTRLGGNYSEGVRSRLVSPEFRVPDIKDNPRLRFWHWFSFSSGDYAYVQIRTENGDWKSRSIQYAGPGSSVWTYTTIDLSEYADSLIQIAFYFHSDNVGSSAIDVSSGWYLDDFQIVTGAYFFNNPEGFETGIGDWFAERGTWQVGAPSVGPGGAYTGETCVGTRLNGNYDEGVRSRFISPPILVNSIDENPNLRFWHWFSFSSGDYGEVYVKTEHSDWKLISNRFSGTSSGVWTTFYADLSAYADSVIHIAFYFHSDNTGSSAPDVSSGWYIDEISLPGPPPNHNPILSMPDSITFDNDSNAQLCMWDYAEDAETADSLLNYFFSVSDSSIKWSYESNTGMLSLSAPDFEGNAWLFTTVSDEQGAYARDTCEVIVSAPVGISEYSSIESFEYALYQNYPNPFNPISTIAFQILKPDHVTIEIYNVCGQKITTLVNRSLPAGKHSVLFDGSGLVSGIYYYRIVSGSYNKAHKMLLVK